MMKFNEKYNPEEFLNFLRDFLPVDFLEKEEDIIINIDRYKIISKATILGFCESLDLHVLEMDHAKEKDPRVAITTDAFKILADHWIHRALVVFKNNDSENYRFSYLTISLDLNDKNKAVKKYSNARRYSFYLGVDAKVRTPEQQLVKKDRIQNIEDLLNRFSVEVVNKQFYLEVAKYFDELVLSEDKNLLLPSVSQEDVNFRKSFAVRLIGRLMFCWFLKQKKSVSGQLIPDELLSSTTAKKTKNYYHDILEPLFFEVLNTDIESRGIRNELFDKVPYLNGGLFNPQSDDFYELDRETFSSKFLNTLSINDKWFIDFFELLEMYNFTIDENTVFDQELSVDPEMLGRIFENLLAKKINSETGANEQKETGSFYTPRSVVEYMVDQSLIEYLKTKTKINDNKLAALISYDLMDDAEYPLGDGEKQEVINAIEALKILDPACGSGAYPIGALQKIVYILQQIDPDCALWLEEKLKGVPELYKQKIISEVKANPFDYTRKLDVIKNSIFGVDIQPIAVDVSRLRCFLTLVVESEIDDTKPNRGIWALPNLDFKFVCANTLINLPKTASSGLFDDHSGITELSKIMSEYFSCNSQRKNEIKIKFTNAQKDILNRTISNFGRSTGELTLKLTSWNPFGNTSSSWFDPEWMFGLEEKFDIVIGNPPYVSTKGVDTSSKKDLEDNFGFADDLYSHFYFKGIELCKDLGVLSYITSKTFWTIQTKKNVRELLLTNNLISIYDTANPFESAMVDTCVVLVKKEENKANEINFLKAERDYLNPVKQQVNKVIYQNAVNEVIFNPSPGNLAIYHKYNAIVSELMEKWWPLINTSKNITKYGAQIEKYRDNLKIGDITLLGLITDGGQGLATANNGKYIGVLSTTKEAIKVKEARINKFVDFVTKQKITDYGANKELIRTYLNNLSELEMRNLFDSSKEKYGRDIFGQGFLYRIIDPSEIKNANSMSEDEKKNGLSGNQVFVPYDKGDKDGNRWYLRTPFYIDWSIRNVKFLKENSGKKGEGMPVLRNPQFYLRAGFCWILTLNEQSEYQKARIKEPGVFDVNAMSLFVTTDIVSEKYLVCLLNSYLIFQIKRNFINGSSAFQINDARQIPIIIPNKEQLANFEDIFDRAYAIKVSQFDEKITSLLAEQKLQEIQKELDEKVLYLYGLK